MSVKGYTSVLAISAYLAQISSAISTLTSDQQDQATTLMGAAETLIDRETRRQWMVPAITGERYDLTLPVLYLTQAPVTSVESIATRTTQVGDTPTTLTAGTDYELIDPTLGQIVFASGYGAADPGAPRLQWAPSIAFVSYTPNRPVPADISHVATLICAHSLYMTLNNDRWGIERAQVQGVNMTVQYDGALTQLVVPDAAQTILDSYRLPTWG